jgi:hypothetical protein
MRASPTITAHSIVLLASAIHSVSAKPAQATGWKQKLATFQQANQAAGQKPE